MLTPNFTPFPTLETTRLVLRQMTTGDASPLFFLRSNKEVMKFINREPDVNLEEAIHFISRIAGFIQKNEAVQWGICLQGTTELIGTIGFWNLQKEHYRAEIGYMLHPAHQCKGLMKEAILKVLDYGFGELGLHSVEANINVDNTASQKLLDSAGFVREGLFRENVYYNGRFSDSAIY